MRLVVFLTLFIIGASCEKERQPFEVYTPAVFLSESQKAVLQKWQGEQPPIAEPLITWQFSLGQLPEYFLATAKDFPSQDSLVNLPHRISYPNRSMWYKTRILLDSAILLVVNADDGAQVFYQGVQVPQSLPNAFTLSATSDSTDLIIRVLNNALEGGLRKAELFPLNEGLTYFGHKDYAAPDASYPLFNNAAKPMLLAKPYLQEQVPGEYLLKVVSTSSAPPSLVFGLHREALDNRLTVDTQTGRIFNFQLKSLLPATTYYYQFRQGNFQSVIYQLQTAPQKETFSFTAWGDSQGGWPIFKQLTQSMQTTAADFSIGLGDLVADGSQHIQWLNFLHALHPVAEQHPVFPVIGNHDYDGQYDDLRPVLYQQYIREDTYFSWAYKNCYFIALDPNESFPLGINGKQLRWLEEQLTSPAWQAADWRFLLLHQPPYSQGWPGYHGDEFIRDLIEEKAATAKIDFVLSGHSHCYERLSKNFDKQTTHFLIMGGAGGGLEPPQSSDYPQMDTIIKAHHYGLFEIDGQKINFQAIGLNNNILDEHIFIKN
ncbi:metallophosphoesterase family protein [Lewinella cohaerens]|uniref:metallophosphoesterase family protein n=1 Tax=Lewinella cohaerens TaxID=70995 RepID=UPI00037A9D51|nr:metallophosphoesterase [Lewinella cohaerens]